MHCSVWEDLEGDWHDFTERSSYVIASDMAASRGGGWWFGVEPVDHDRLGECQWLDRRTLYNNVGAEGLWIVNCFPGA